MDDASAKQTGGLFRAVPYAIGLTFLVVFGTWLTGFDKDPVNLGFTALLMLAVSLVTAAWLHGHSHVHAGFWMLGTFVVLLFYMFVGVKFRNRTPHAKIVFPTGVGSVPQFTKVAGSQEHIPDDRYIWVCVHTPEDPNYKYYCSSASKHPNGTWESDNINGVQVGTSSASKEVLPYSICVWLAGRVLKSGGEGFTVKPPDADQLDEIQVYRASR